MKIKISEKKRNKKAPKRSLNTRNKQRKKRHLSKSKRVGLCFPVGRLHRYLKQRYDKKHNVSPKSAIFMAAVLEYLTAEILELAGMVTKKFKLKLLEKQHK